MNDPMFERTKLPDGPRVISSRMPGSRSLSVAVYILAGSRLETRENAGVAHFMEHVTFKGTRDYPTTGAVSDAIEGCGGSTNAATDRETTIYWARLPVRQAERAFNVLSELVIRPLLRDDDIARERDIIVEEIRSYRDDPGQYVFNLFDRAFFGDTPLGWEIAGEEDTVRGLPESDIRDFWASTYRPANAVISVAGDLSHDDVAGHGVAKLRHRERGGARFRRCATGSLRTSDSRDARSRPGAPVRGRSRHSGATIPISGP